MNTNPETLKDIVTKKAHDSSMSLLSKENVPPKLAEYLTFKYLNSVASALSSVTRNVFLYTGKLHYRDHAVVVAFTSSDRSDTIDMIISYDIEDAEGFEFVNLNNHLLKGLEETEPEVEEIPQEEPIEQEENEVEEEVEEISVPATDAPQEPTEDAPEDVPEEESTEEPPKEVSFSGLGSLIDNVIDKEKEEEKEKAFKDVLDALKKLEVDEELDKKTDFIGDVFK